MWFTIIKSLWYTTTVGLCVLFLNKQGNKDGVTQTSTKENESKQKHCNKIERMHRNTVVEQLNHNF